MEETKSIQIRTATDFKITIDVLSSEALDLTLNAQETKTRSIVESRRNKISSTYEISNVGDAIIKLTEFDRAILNALVSEYLAGNEYTTPERIFRWLGGSYNLGQEMRKAIMASVERLAAVRVSINMEDAQKKIGYGADRGKSTFKGYLMPTESLSTIINGQPADGIHILKRGVIFSVADMKNQIATCHQKLLAAPIHHSERGIALNHFLVRRSLEIKGSRARHQNNKRVKPLRKTISFEAMLKKCGMEGADRDTRRKVKNIVEKILNFLVAQCAIKSFEFETGSKGKIIAIHIGVE